MGQFKIRDPRNRSRASATRRARRLLSGKIRCKLSSASTSNMS